MPDHAVEKLFSLFTTADRAEAIAGDLAEERERRGRPWFWLHVARVTIALWRVAAMDAPLRVLALMFAGCAFLLAPAIGGAAAVGLFPQSIGSPVSWIAVAVFWWGGAAWTGASLVGLAPRRGMAACAALAVAVEMLAIALSAIAIATLWDPRLIMFYVIGPVVGVPLVAGGALLRRRTIAPLFLLLAVAAPGAAQQLEWKDPSPHTARMVAVEDAIELEVLDWGGSGQAVVLLAGLGDTAHVFDDFAPLLTTRYRLLGITRRAHGRSSAPPTGYGFARLAEDVVRVIDAVGVRTPVVAGHSLAGEELHVLGSRHAARVAGLVYVDAAFNRADGSEDYDAVARTLPPAPRPGPADLASFAALRSFLERTYGLAGPDAHLRARYVGNPDGTIARQWTPPPPIFKTMTAEIQAAFKPYAPEPVRVPALALYAVPKSAADVMQRWYDADDPSVRDAVEKLHTLARERFARHAKWFKAFAARGQVSEMAGPHHLFLASPRAVAQQLDAFMASLAATP